MKIILIFLLSSIYMQDVGNNWSDEAKATFYQTERISPENALYLQLGCPLPFCNLGYAYSDNWKRGLKRDLWMIGLMFGGLILTEEEESERRQEEFRARSQMFIDALEVDDVLAHLLVTEGFSSVEEVAFVPIEDLLAIEGID